MLQCTVQVSVEAEKLDYFLRNLAKKGKIKKRLSRGECRIEETLKFALASVTLLS